MDFETRQNRGPGGDGRLLREREVYLPLTQQGYSNREASRIVGINPRTGKRWRNGWHSPPWRKPKPPITAEAPVAEQSRHLREADRIHIADRLREKASIRQIAAELGRSPSTVSKESESVGLRLMRDPLGCELGTCDIRSPSSRFVYLAAGRVHGDDRVKRGLRTPRAARRRFPATPRRRRIRGDVGRVGTPAAWWAEQQPLEFAFGMGASASWAADVRRSPPAPPWRPPPSGTTRAPGYAVRSRPG
ncbi:helix-turn-helix domain-containing protein [Streptomyces sp. NPDC059881]|uniref:helix-turn-helix domain-containing protein n=1 Tax=Streptomyces sp. NPDC059881 TaxID=3346986 RepID=UPI00364CBB4A